jgi:DNA polymerase-3 subunit delta'
MHFQEIIGHKEVGEKLRSTIQGGRISHAQLFSGPQGSGNLAMALAYVQYLFCEVKPEGDACGKCTSCLKNEKIIHPDVHFSFPFFAKNAKDTSDQYLDTFRSEVLENPYMNDFQWFNALGSESKQGIINVNESTEISRKLQFKSYEGGFKVALIWLPEHMHVSAANKLLKLLEEPPPKTVILLVTHSEEKIISTILSRTQIIKIPRLTEDEIKVGLIEKFEMEAELAQNYAAASDGDFLQAVNMAKLESGKHIHFERFREWMRLCFKKDVKGVTQWVQKLAATGRENQKHFLRYGLHLIRQVALLNYGSENLVSVDGEERVFLYRFAPFVHHQNLADFIAQFQLASDHLEFNANPRILFTDLSFQILVLLNRKMN